MIADNALVGGLAAGQRPVGSGSCVKSARDFDLKGTIRRAMAQAASADTNGLAGGGHNEWR